MNLTADFYRILQVGLGADKNEILSSYKRLCKIYHPDLNPTPEAEELMKRINLAYHTLNDPKRRAEYDRCRVNQAQKSPVKTQSQAQEDMKAANAVMSDYFQQLFNGAYAKAFTLLSDYDKKYVTLDSFCKWRSSVQRLYTMRSFKLKNSEAAEDLAVEGRKPPGARKIYIDILEKNHNTQATNHYIYTKFAVKDQGGWKVFLGHRDLNEIARIFQELSYEQEKEAIYKHWEDYCRYTHRELDILNYEGFIKEATKEVYRAKRYRQTLTVVLLSVKTLGSSLTQAKTLDLWEGSAAVLKKSLRETDIPAYLGKGVFMVLFVELKKRHAPVIIERLLDRIKGEAARAAKSVIKADCKFDVYSGSQELRPWLENFIADFPPGNRREAL